MTTTLPDLFWAKVKSTDCLLWTGAVNSRGYGCFAVDGVSQLAHRLAYEDAYGPIPDGLVIDHLCRTHNCVNPDHLEAVTSKVNNRRGKRLEYGGTCTKGHRIGGSVDIYESPTGARECMECRRTSRRKYRAQDRLIGDFSDVRRWALEQGYMVRGSGPIPRAIREAYLEATNRRSA